MATRIRPAGPVVLATLALSIAAAISSLHGVPPTAAHDGQRAVDAEPGGAPDRRRLAWIDRAGRTTPVAAPRRGYAYPRLSPDGRRIALDIRDGQRGLWMWDVIAATLSPFATSRASDISPVWSRTGAWLLFARGRGVAPGLFRVDVGGEPGRPRQPTASRTRLPAESNSLLMPTSLTPDDRHAVVTSSVASGLDLMAIDLRGSGTPVPLVTTAADDLNGELSPDGQWLAYQSRVSGQFEVWAKRWGADGAGTHVTSTGGTRPVWTRGGRELIYLTHDGDMMAVAAYPGPSALTVGTPQRLFTADIYRDLVGRTFDVSPDGERFLAIFELERTGRPPTGQDRHGRAGWHLPPIAAISSLRLGQAVGRLRACWWPAPPASPCAESAESPESQSSLGADSFPPPRLRLADEQPPRPGRGSPAWEPGYAPGR